MSRNCAISFPVFAFLLVGVMIWMLWICASLPSLRCMLLLCFEPCCLCRLQTTMPLTIWPYPLVVLLALLLAALPDVRELLPRGSRRFRLGLSRLSPVARASRLFGHRSSAAEGRRRILLVGVRLGQQVVLLHVLSSQLILPLSKSWSVSWRKSLSRWGRCCRSALLGDLTSAWPSIRGNPSESTLTPDTSRFSLRAGGADASAAGAALSASPRLSTIAARARNFAALSLLTLPLASLNLCSFCSLRTCARSVTTRSA